MDTVIEEKTPKGIILKIMPEKSKFLAFAREGATIYADENKTKLIHDIPTVVFIGNDFIIPANGLKGDFSLHKVLKGKALIAFKLHENDRERYLFVPVSCEVDLIPLKLKKMASVAELVKAIQGGLKPLVIIVTNSITRGDVIIIKNRFSEANIVLVDDQKTSFEAEIIKSKQPDEIPEERRAVDIVKEVNINMLSNNPVFLARLHLRELNFSKVSQLLFDFELSKEETEYILSFLETMIHRSKEKGELAKSLEKIMALRNSFQFYLHLMNMHDEEIRKMICECRSLADVAAYRTLIAKVKPLYEGTETEFALTDYENLLYEQNERSQ
jgi:hypothetical protein